MRQKPKLALRALTAAAAVLIALPLAILTTLPTSALAVTNHSNGASVAGRAKPPTATATETTCTPAAASGPQRCVRVQRQRLSLSTLSAAQRSDRNAMLSKQIAKDKASRTNAATASSSVSLTPPADCLLVPGNVAGNYDPNPDRFTSCSDAMITVTSYPVVDWVPDYKNPNGGFQYEDAQWNSYSATSQSWTHGLIVVGYPAPTYAWGTLDAGISAQMYSGCYLATGICTAISLGNPDPQSVTVLPSSTQEFGWTEYDDGPSATSANSSNWMDSYLGVSYDLDIVPPEPVNDLSELSGRCDTMATATDGCVDEYYYPVLTYNAQINPLVQPVAQHIYNAQSGIPANGGLSIAWGVPSAYNSTGQALTRDTTPGDDVRNNAVACASVTTTPGVTSCDEFPFKSTYQGAAFQSVWSAVPVPISANSSQGGLTGAFYNSNRVIDDDPFYVNVVLQNGAVSW
jgi:hypothetical protein